MRYIMNLAISNRREWDNLGDEVKKLKNEIKQLTRENAELQSKIAAYATGCLYGGAHCETCKNSRKVSGFVSYGMGYYKENTHVCTLDVPCGQFKPKEETP